MPSTAKGNIPLEASNHPIVRLYFSLNRGKNRRPASERLPMEEPYVYSAGTKAQIASSCAPPSSTNASTPLMAIYKLTAVTTRASRIYDIYFIFIFYCQRQGSGDSAPCALYPGPPCWTEFSSFYGRFSRGRRGKSKNRPKNRIFGLVEPHSAVFRPYFHVFSRRGGL